MPTIEERAREKLNEVRKERSSELLVGNAFTRLFDPTIEAFCREIEAHDATLAEFEVFRRDVSDEIERCILSDFAKERLCRFILPKPVDPLVDVADEIHVHRLSLEQALAKRGLKLVEVGE